MMKWVWAEPGDYILLKTKQSSQEMLQYLFLGLEHEIFLILQLFNEIQIMNFLNIKLGIIMAVQKAESLTTQVNNHLRIRMGGSHSSPCHTMEISMRIISVRFLPIT